MNILHAQPPTSLARCPLLGPVQPALRSHRRFQRHPPNVSPQLLFCTSPQSPQPAPPQASAAPPQTLDGEDVFEGLLPDEDTVVPGGYEEAMNSNTKLGKAVRAAVSELSHLNTLERDMLQQAQGLFQRLGVRMPLDVTPPVQPGIEDDQGDETYY
ncbi:predicted protein [Haematococcus lacustris]|uniref:Uncharacterized protein n=1 Tax=Haematococcus lacustris TaxID=44745 RepID=A0A699YAS8_HAELA|nr:predicted protein [Haematococcus lacustris]